MSNSIWRKRVLVPFWIVQLLFTVILLGSAIVVLTAVNVAEYNGDLAGSSNAVHLTNISAGILVAFAALTIIFDITEIILFARQKLRPVANIVLQSIKTLIWSLYFLLAVIAIAKYNASGLSIFFSLVLFGSCLGQIIYASVILHRHRNGTLYRGQYARGDAGTGYNIGYNAPPFEGARMQTSYASPSGGAQQLDSMPAQSHSFYEPTSVPSANNSYPGYQPYRAA